MTVRKVRPVNIGGVAGLLAVTVTVVVAGLASACVPQPRLITVQPRSSGPPGMQVTVSGLSFDPGRAEIRWNSVDGDLLGSTTGPDFSVPVKIPDAQEGLYHIIVLSRSSGGELGNTATVSFQVTSPEGSDARPSPPVWTVPGPEATDDPNDKRAVLFAFGGGGLVALGCIGGMLLSRRRRTRPPVDGNVEQEA